MGVETKRNPFDYVKSINKKEYIDDVNGFSPFLTNRVFSVGQDFIHLANMMNQKGAYRLPKKAIYDFYFYVVPQNPKRFLKYPKSQELQNKVKYIMRWFAISEQVAKDYLEVLDKEEIQKIVKYYEKRGKQ